MWYSTLLAYRLSTLSSSMIVYTAKPYKPHYSERRESRLEKSRNSDSLRDSSPPPLNDTDNVTGNTFPGYSILLSNIFGVE